MNALAIIVAVAQFSPPHIRPASERITDGLGAGITAALGFVPGFIGGALFGIKTGDDFDGKIEGGVYWGLALGAVTSVLGGVAFDAASDGDGNVWGMGVGALGGLAGGVALGTTFDDSDYRVITWLAAIGVGAGLGYALFDSESALPTLGMVPNREGGLDATVGLTGTF